MEKDGRVIAGHTKMLVLNGLLIAVVAGLFIRFPNRIPWNTNAFFNSFLLVICAWNLVEWWLARKDPEPFVTKWTRSLFPPLLNGICVCALSYVQIRFWPTFSAAVIAGILVSSCFTGMQAYGFYLQRKGLRSGQTSDPIPPAVTN